jgi:cell division protein ZapE
LKSLYLWGDPGAGKTFIMDHFFGNIDLQEKKKLHYNEFMLSVHEEEHRINRELKNVS